MLKEKPIRIPTFRLKTKRPKPEVTMVITEGEPVHFRYVWPEQDKNNVYEIPTAQHDE